MLHNFSLVTSTGENVLRTDFERRRLEDYAVDRLKLKFFAVEKTFEFEFQRSNPIFASGSTIKVTGVSKICSYTQAGGAGQGGG